MSRVACWLVSLFWIALTVALAGLGAGACRADLPPPNDQAPNEGEGGAGGVGGSGGTRGRGGAGGARADAAVDLEPPDSPVADLPSPDRSAAPDLSPDAPAPTCGLPRLVCCPGNTCSQGGCCYGGRCVENGTACSNAATCLNGSCGGCGGVKQRCCAIRAADGGALDDVCTAAGTACLCGQCQRCGGTGEPCCADGSCSDARASCCGRAMICLMGGCAGAIDARRADR